VEPWSYRCVGQWAVDRRNGKKEWSGRSEERWKSGAVDWRNGGGVERWSSGAVGRRDDEAAAPPSLTIPNVTPKLAWKWIGGWPARGWSRMGAVPKRCALW